MYVPTCWLLIIFSIYSSKGECFKYKTFRFKGLEKTKDKLKSKLDRKKKKSKKWIKLNKTFLRKKRKLCNKRKDYLHKKSKQIINYCLLNNIDNVISIFHLFNYLFAIKSHFSQNTYLIF